MPLTEKHILNIVKRETDIANKKSEELQRCFDQLKKDLELVKKSQRRIERVLLGDKDYNDIGMAHMVTYSYDYARRNTESEIVPRAEKALKKYYIYEENGNWEAIEDIVDKYKAIKWFSIIITSSGLISTANIIYMILKLLGGG